MISQRTIDELSTITRDDCDRIVNGFLGNFKGWRDIHATEDDEDSWFHATYVGQGWLITQSPFDKEVFTVTDATGCIEANVSEYRLQGSKYLVLSNQDKSIVIELRIKYGRDEKEVIG